MKTQPILIADDEPDVRQMVSMNLHGAGFQVITAADGEAALDAVREQSPALAILDIMMPHMTGLEVCRAMKASAKTARIPVVILTARSGEIDRVLAFELGVDDFVTKPFSMRELLLRVKAILRAKQAPQVPTAISAGDISLDRDRHLVTVRGKRVNLTAIEFKLLCSLVESKGRVLHRETLLTRVWGSDTAIDGRTVDTHVRRLREKLQSAASQLQTVRSFGYRLEDRQDSPA